MWFIFKNAKLLIDPHSMQPYQAKNISLNSSIYMGTFKNFHLHVGEAQFESAPSGAVWEDLKAHYGRTDEAFFALAGRAVQLLFWDRTHQFCGQCGHKMSEK